MNTKVAHHLCRLLVGEFLVVGSASKDNRFAPETQVALFQRVVLLQ